MIESSAIINSTPASMLTLPPEEKRWWQIALGILPVFVIGLGGVLEVWPGGGAVVNSLMHIGMILFLGGYLVILVGLFAGWMAGFPRWVYPYLVYGVIFALYISQVSTPGLVIFNIEMWGREIWGWHAWVPFATISLVALLLSRPPWGPLKYLGCGLWEDWTKCSFGLFGLMPLAVLVLMDEVDRSYRFPATVICMLLVVIGAYLYQSITNKTPRFLALLGTALFVSIIATITSEAYFQTHRINMATGKYELSEGVFQLKNTIAPLFQITSMMAILFLSPALIWITRKLWEAIVSRKQFR